MIYLLFAYLGLGIFFLFINPLAGFIKSGYRNLVVFFVRSKLRSRKIKGILGILPLFLLICLLVCFYPIVFLIRYIKGSKSYSKDADKWGFY
jgi:hypothetical protein